MKKRVIALAAACLLLIGLTACGTGGTGDKEKITFSLDWAPNTNHTGVYVALEKGYFDEAGLEVEIIQPPEGSALPLVASGKAQFGISFQEEVASALTAEDPMDVTAVAAIIQHNTSGIISLKDKGIKSPKDMAGHNYASWDTPIEKAILKAIITADGGDYDKVEMIPNTVTDVITALQTDVDTVWVYYGWDGIATEVKDVETNYFYLKDFDPALDFYSPLIAASNDYLEKNGDTAKKFIAAVSKGYEYAIENPEEAAEILVKHAPEVDIDIAKASQEYLAEQYKADAARWGVFDQARWDAFYTWLYDNKVIPGKIDAGVGFTNDYLPQ
jgi:ABC-type nitrate/sulfonate/bicarbonate transport system substrate-binding protein